MFPVLIGPWQSRLTNRHDKRAKGADIIAGGLGLQTVALLGFCGLHFWFTVGLSSRRDTMDPKHSSVYSSIQFKRFIMGKSMDCSKHIE